MNPCDPEARITKLKDGRTHLAYKAEHAVNFETGAVVAVMVATGDAGDTEAILETLPQAGEHIAEVAWATNQKDVGRTSASRRSIKSGDGQGISQQRHAGGDGGSGSADVYLRTGSRTAALSEARRCGGAVGARLRACL